MRCGVWFLYCFQVRVKLFKIDGCSLAYLTRKNGNRGEIIELVVGHKRVSSTTLESAARKGQNHHTYAQHLRAAVNAKAQKDCKVRVVRYSLQHACAGVDKRRTVTVKHSAWRPLL